MIPSRNRVRLRFLLPLLLLMPLAARAQPQSSTEEIYPVIPYIFFDSGSAAIPARYQLASPSRDGGPWFIEGIVADNVPDPYYSVLSMIGSRLRNSPGTSVEIVGIGSERTAGIGDAKLAAERARAVRNYLAGAWRIDTARLRVGTRMAPGAVVRPESVEEWRRVEIISHDWEINRPTTWAVAGERFRAMHRDVAPGSRWIGVYTLALFTPNSSAMGPVNERIIRELMIPMICCDASIQVVGLVYDEFEEDFPLARKRAEAVAEQIRRMAKPGSYASIEGRVALPSEITHAPSLPEGRFYDHAVEIRITAPAGR